VHQAIEVITLPAHARIQAETELFPEKFIVGHFGIGVVRTDLVQHHEKKDKRIGNARKRETPVGQRHQDDEHQHQSIFQGPVVTILRFDREQHEHDREQRSQNQEIFSMRQHRPSRIGSL